MNKMDKMDKKDRDKKDSQPNEPVAPLSRRSVLKNGAAAIGGAATVLGGGLGGGLAARAATPLRQTNVGVHSGVWSVVVPVSGLKICACCQSSPEKSSSGPRLRRPATRSFVRFWEPTIRTRPLFQTIPEWA